MAILDTAQNYRWDEAWHLWSEITGNDGAIYHPWVRVRSRDDQSIITIPPSGHVAGVFARTDKERGVHKAPANEVVRGVVDLDHFITSAEQDFLNPKGVNCIRSFPGRGIRIWGARTLSGHADWQYVNVRRVFLTVVRWIQTFLWTVVFEPNDPELERRMQRELTAYFNGQFRRGALKGATPEEAFYVKCDAETNSRAGRDAGQLITEIGLAMSAPLEFIVVRLIYGTTGVHIEGPVAATQQM
jgi:phage tail sheath protein FI